MQKFGLEDCFWIAGLGLLMIFGPYFLGPKIDLPSQETDYPAVSSKVLAARIEEFPGRGGTPTSKYYELALYLDQYGRFFLKGREGHTKNELEPYLEKVEIGGVLTVHYLSEIEGNRGHRVVSIRTPTDDVLTFEETVARRGFKNVPQVVGAIMFTVGLVLIYHFRRKRRYSKS